MVKKEAREVYAALARALEPVSRPQIVYEDEVYSSFVAASKELWAALLWGQPARLSPKSLEAAKAVHRSLVRLAAEPTARYASMRGAMPNGGRK